MEKLLDQDLIHYSDLFIAVLLQQADATFLPELYEVFGDKLVLFLDIFAGTTFVVPSRQVIEKAVRHVAIYHKLESGRYKEEELAREYGVDIRWVREIRKQVQNIAKVIDG